MNSSIKITLPMIKRLAPSSIANDIVGVQPMTTIVYRLEIFDEFVEEFDMVCYGVKVLGWGIFTSMSGMDRWAMECINDRYVRKDNKYYFKHEKDRTLFLLKWST